MTEDGDVYVVTDNDALDDANGETVFAKAGVMTKSGMRAERPGHGHGH